MWRAVLGIFVPAAMALAGCAAGQVGGEQLSNEETCGYDAETLMPAMEAAVPADATVQMALEMAGAGQEIAMDAAVAYTAGGAEIDMTFDGPGQDFALIVVENRVFISDSAGGGTYKEVHASDRGFAGLRSQADSMDIASEFAAWKAGLEKVEQRGEDEIDGERVCHYSLTVNTADAAEAQGEPLPQGMPQTVTYELYLTANDLMRRATFEMGEIDGELNATNWNEPVDIQAPNRN